MAGRFSLGSPCVIVSSLQRDIQSTAYSASGTRCCLCVSRMSFAGASPFLHGQVDPCNNTCTLTQISARRSWSSPLHRAFSSSDRPCRCASLGPHTRQLIAAASLIADAEPQQQHSLSRRDDRLSQLEASYLAQSAAQFAANVRQTWPAHDAIGQDEDFAQLERSWQAQAEASISGRSETSPADAFAPKRRRKLRAKNTPQSSRSAAPAPRRRQSQRQGVVTQAHSSSVSAAVTSDPDKEYCLALKIRLQKLRKGSHRGSDLADIQLDTDLDTDASEARDSSLLSRREEARLSQIFQKGFALKQPAATSSELPGSDPLEEEGAEEELPAPITDSQDFSAAEMQQMRNMEDAKNLLLQYNVRLVYSQARAYLGKEVDFADLVTEGLIGMNKAIEKFDPSRGFKFSTYAHWWIKQSLARCIAHQSRVVVCPVHVYEGVSKINRARVQLTRQGIQQPSYHQIGDAIGLKASRVRDYLQQTGSVKSLESPVYVIGSAKGDSDVTLQDTLTSEQQVEEEEEQQERKHDEEHLFVGAKDNLNALLMTLLPRERNVLRMRYGLHDAKGTCMTFTDIAAAYGLSRERVRQIETRALSKLRTPGWAGLLQKQAF